MENKIREYVDYEFRGDNQEEILDLKEEIVANLIDRFNQLKAEGFSDDDAYVNAIKQMGDFHADKQPTKIIKIKPSIVDLALVFTLVSAIFGLLLILFNVVVGAVITGISISVYACTANYLYQSSQYIKQNYMDIEKQNIYLNKIVKNLRPTYIFWSISLSLLLSSIFKNFILSLAVGMIDNYNDMRLLMIICGVIFVLAVIILLVLFTLCYNKIIAKIKYLTGECSNLESNKRAFSLTDLFKNRFLNGVIYFLLATIFLCSKIGIYSFEYGTVVTTNKFFSNLFGSVGILSLINAVVLVGLLINLVLYIFKHKKQIILMSVLLVICLSSYFLNLILFGQFARLLDYKILSIGVLPIIVMVLIFALIAVYVIIPRWLAKRASKTSSEVAN